MKDIRFFLTHILECIGKIEAYTRSGQGTFMGSAEKQDAVIRNFEIIGEAAKQVPDSIRKSFPTIPWQQIAGFRDVLIHHYWGVDANEVWNIIQRDLPKIKPQIEEVLQTL